MSDARSRRNRQNTLTLIGALGASLAIVLLLVLVTVRPTNLDRNEVDWGSVWTTVAENEALANPEFVESDGDWWSNRAELIGGQYPVWYIGFISPTMFALFRGNIVVCVFTSCPNRLFGKSTPNWNNTIWIFL